MSSPPAPDQKSLVGYTIGKCKLLRICGRGAMGTVYKGMHSGLDIEVAVKILPPHLANNSNLVERFMREAKLAARLNHFNNVRVYDVGEESGYNYLVMEFIEGADALELVKRHGPQKATVVADIGAGAARALEHAHENNVIHRDIKPANLMLPNAGGVKVADFGLARALSSESGLTMTGAIMGTPDYMAPEQAQGESVGPLADIYSLGSTLYHLFVGRPPFQGSSPMAVALQHVTNRVVVPEEMVTDEASQQLTRVIHELTQKDPKKRPSSLNDIARRLQKIARGDRGTQKLLSEGATLYATAGVTLDADAISQAKQDEAALEMNKGRVQSPHLDKLRRAAEKARSGMHAVIPEPAAAPKAPPSEMAELTGDMVREARAKSRRSSGQIKALPQDADRNARRTSNPSMSPHRETRPTSSSSSRRSRIVQDPEMDDEAWQSYAAKSFPTFERSSIIEGSVPGEIVRERDGGSSVMSGSGSSVDFSKPMGGMETPTWTPPKKRKSGGIISLVVAVLIICGIAGAIWFFVLRTPGNDNKGTGQHVAGLTVSKFQAHAKGSGITAIATQGGGVGFYTGGEDGMIHRWMPGSQQPEASQKVPEGAVTEIVMRSDNQRLVVGTSAGAVVLLDAMSLKIMRTEMSVNARVTVLLPVGVSELVVGDSQGRLTLKNGTKRLKVDPSGAPITGLVYRNGEIWAAAGKTIATYKIESNELAEKSSFSNVTEPIHNLLATEKGVFAVVGKQVRRMSPQGPAAGGYGVRFTALGITHDHALLVAVGENGVALLNPETLESVAVATLERQDTILCAGSSTQQGRFYLGTRSGELYQCTYN